ncbi:MAG: ABC transporter substrate-binding protein, partial [Nitrospira sp.]|nr:ABC transporter substrate-binding protein [Nitrospira sp.]
TVNIVTKVVDPYLDAKMAGFGGNMVPRHYLQEKGYGALLTTPIGTGPYKFQSWVKDGDTTLEAYEGYWGKPPQIKTVIIRPIPEGATRAAALKAGEVDVIQNLPPTEVEPVKASGIAQPISVPSVRIMFVQIDSFRGPTKDKRVRQALNYAIDVPELIEFILEGNGIQVADFLSPLIFGHDPTLAPYPYDPDKAKKLLAEAGYPDGFEIGFDCSRGRYLQDKEIVEAMAGQLVKVGIKAKVTAHEWSLYVSKMSGYQCAPLSLWGWGNSALDADNSLYPRMHCPASGTPKNSLETYCNKELDAVLEEARSILDKDKRLALYAKAQRIATEDPPFIFLYQLQDLYGVSHRIKWTPRSDEMIWPYEMSLA